MSGQFITVDFYTDPFEGRRVRVAAVGKRDVERVIARGDIAGAALAPVHRGMIEEGLEELAAEGGLERPESMGPQFEMSSPRDIPDEVGDLAAWLKDRTRDAWPLQAFDVPQADDLMRVVAVVPALESGRPFADVTPRQWAYYRHAARILGLVELDRDEPTQFGTHVARASHENQLEVVRIAFHASNCGRAWLDHARATGVGDLPRGSALAFLDARVPTMAVATRRRRAATLERWREVMGGSG